MAQRAKRVALLLDAGRAFDRGLLQGISQYVNLHEPWIIIRPVAFYQRPGKGLRGSLDEIRDAAPDGILMNYSPLEPAIKRLRVPTIIVPVEPVVDGRCYLLCDNRGVARLAAEHLAGLGLRHFAFAGFDGAVWSTERNHHFCERLAEMGHAAVSHLVPLSAPKPAAARQEAALVRWLKALPKPVGLMACNDEFARSLAELCRVHRLRLPEQVALIGVDNDELICELNRPPLSSVSFAVERAGYEAAEALDRLMIRKRTKIADILVRAGRVVARQSTNVLAIGDPDVVRAMQFIRENSHRIIQVRDVIAATLLSHRTLHNRFRQAVGHSLVQEMHRQRADYIARMLLETNDPVSRIARAMGYGSAAHLSRFFHRETGVTPRAYRISHQGRTAP